MARESFVKENVEIYIDYDYLTVEQYSNILSATNDVYKNLASILMFSGLSYVSVPYVITYPVPLCLEEARTGNSIKSKFSFDKRFFPGVEIDGDGDFNIILPRWTAVLIISGLVLGYGIDRYKDYLDVRLKQLEVDEKIREEVESQSKKLDSIKSKNNPVLYMVQQNIYQFQSQIYQSNIKEVQVNGQIVHQKNKQ